MTTSPDLPNLSEPSSEGQSSSSSTIVLPPVKNTEASAENNVASAKPLSERRHQHSAVNQVGEFSQKSIAEKKPAEKNETRVYRPDPEEMKQRRQVKKRSAFIRQSQQLIKLGIIGLLCVGLYKAAIVFPWAYTGGVEWIGTPSHLVNPEHIESALQQEKNFFALKPQRVANELKDRYPLIEQAVVRRRFFPKQALLVSVTEKPLWGLVHRKPLTENSAKKPSLVVSSDNLIFPLASLANFNAYQSEHQQHLTHLLIPANRQEMMTALQLKQLQALSKRIQIYPDLSLRYIDLRDPNALILVCHGPDVYLGRLDETWATRFDRLVSLMPHYKKWTGEMRAIDLRWKNQVTLHPFIKK